MYLSLKRSGIHIISVINITKTLSKLETLANPINLFLKLHLCDCAVHLASADVHHVSVNVFDPPLFRSQEYIMPVPVLNNSIFLH